MIRYVNLIWLAEISANPPTISNNIIRLRSIIVLYRGLVRLINTAIDKMIKVKQPKINILAR